MREIGGLIELPPPLRPGVRVRTTRGLFTGHGGLCIGQPAHERVAILLNMLGASRRVTVPMANLETLP